jgi:hypothetical protein
MITKVTLATIAHARSGDKGNHANVAVLAYTPAGFNWIRKHLTAEVVEGYFASLKPSRVVRYEAANVLGLNFVLYDILAGGASRSLRVDSQGKTLGLALLHMEIEPGEKLGSMVRPKKKIKEFRDVVEDLRNAVRSLPVRKPRRTHD